jgi:hypothetical protein
MQVKGLATEDEDKAALCEGSSAIGHGSKGPYVGFKTQPVEFFDGIYPYICFKEYHCV